VITPYYDDGQITIYHGDCLDVLPSLVGESIDLVLTDPPYGVDYLSNRRIRDTEVAQVIHADDSLDAMRGALALCAPLMKDDAHCYYFASADETVGDACRALPLSMTFHRLLCWDKGNHGMGDLERDYGHAWEAIVYATKGRGRALNPPRPSSLLSGYGRGSGVTWVHPTQKPVTLMKFLIERSSVTGETVLDPFMGSGTTLRAAKDLGRRAIGIEINEQYCEIAVRRLAQEVLL
jgi:site-specific DNA-methyltransferase (adenine-specific)